MLLRKTVLMITSLLWAGCKIYLLKDVLHIIRVFIMILHLRVLLIKLLLPTGIIPAAIPVIMYLLIMAINIFPVLPVIILPHRVYQQLTIIIFTRVQHFPVS